MIGVKVNLLSPAHGVGKYRLVIGGMVGGVASISLSHVELSYSLLELFLLSYALTLLL